MQHSENLVTSQWFYSLRDRLCGLYESIENEYAKINNLIPGKFDRKSWSHIHNGGGEISIMRGNVFEKVGVNVSRIESKFSEDFRSNIPGTESDPSFYATGVSLVSHMCSPLVPAAHFNTRFIRTGKLWFGGGGDLTPIYEDKEETEYFHSSMKRCCDRYDLCYYEKFKKACDEYFYLKHRKEPRGVGGIFYDYLNTENFDADFNFTKDVGLAFLDVYGDIVRRKMNLKWTEEQRKFQLIRRGRYVEFNLLYDRGTKFGLMTNGNVEAILMSMPPVVEWP